MHGSWLESCILRSGASGTSDVDHARVAVATTAKTAKEKCLPVLQANQDVFRYSPILPACTNSVEDYNMYNQPVAEVFWRSTSTCVGKRWTLQRSFRHIFSDVDMIRIMILL